MLNMPSKEVLNSLPLLYATEDVPAGRKLLYLHFFFGNCHWFACEFDGEDLFFGYAILNGDMQNAEWGYFTLSELNDICLYGFEVVRDLEWKPLPAAEVELLKGWLR